MHPLQVESPGLAGAGPTLCQQAEEGVLALRVADSVTMENAAEAHKKLEAGGTRGRMVIEF